MLFKKIVFQYLVLCIWFQSIKNTRILTLALMSERIGAKTFAKKYLPGSVGMDEIGFQSFDFSPMHPKLQTFLASIRLSSRVRHLNIKICSFEYYLVRKMGALRPEGLENIQCHLLGADLYFQNPNVISNPKMGSNKSISGPTCK